MNDEMTKGLLNIVPTTYVDGTAGYWNRNINDPFSYPGSPGIVTDPNRKIFDQYEWERICKELAKVTKQGESQKLVVDDVVTRTLKYRGVTFVVLLSDRIVEFFEDLKNISREEMHLVEITYPKEYAKIRETWMEAWTRLQAQKAFENS